ncbi:ankyrin repeat domain-containing protein 54 [Fopius arisanus]|uniref:Ankyrin repeat domain-containing protein 54 n=1 Tax=Fopius arisanus TaxID=64838 RepID=A0A9R1TPD2_9HYME|nr:PREDICTED: ankyrin repeat domain-containing protein 54-like [Fopius arisanus]
MTSVDSGVETGNESNDSGQAEGQLLFVSPSTNSVKRGRVQDVKKIPEHNGKQLELVMESNEEITPPKTIVCLPQNSHSLPLNLNSLDKAVQFNFPEYMSDTKLVDNTKDQWCVNRFMPRRLNKLCYRRMKRIPYRNQLRFQKDWERRMRMAAATNNVELVTNLLEKGVSPNNTDCQGRSPLHMASSSGYTDVVKVLLDFGANPNMTDTLGNTPLHLAAVTSKMPIVVLLLKAGTNVLSSDRHGYNPLQLAQTKLRMLQKSGGSELSVVKEEVHKVVEMLMAYLQQQKNVDLQIEALSSFCARLSVSHTTDQVQDDVKNLLASIDSLSLSNN